MHITTEAYEASRLHRINEITQNVTVSFIVKLLCMLESI